MVTMVENAELKGDEKKEIRNPHKITMCQNFFNLKPFPQKGKEILKEIHPNSRFLVALSPRKQLRRIECVMRKIKWQGRRTKQRKDKVQNVEVFARY